MHPKEDLFFLWVKALIKNDEWKYLLLLADRSHIPWHEPQYWDLPGGRVDYKEDFSFALKREIAEETWIQEIVLIDDIGMVASNFRLPYPDREYWLILSIYLFSCASSDVTLSEEHISFQRCTKEVVIERLFAKYPSDFIQILVEKL